MNSAQNRPEKGKRAGRSRSLRSGAFCRSVDVVARAVLRWSIAGGVVCVVACSGARHRKVNGPPPEYEPPDDPAALDAKDGGAGVPAVKAADGGAPAEPTRS